MRKSDGVYQFGSQRVTVHVNANKIKICVGGVTGKTISSCSNFSETLNFLLKLSG